MIETTLGQCVAAAPALERLAGHDLPVRSAYQLAKLVAVVTAEAEACETQRGALVKKHGEEREATADERATLGASVYTVRPDALAAFVREVQELHAIPVTIPVAPFSLNTLNGAVMTARDVALLGPLVTLEEETRGDLPN